MEPSHSPMAGSSVRPIWRGRRGAGAAPAGREAICHPAAVTAQATPRPSSQAACSKCDCLKAWVTSAGGRRARLPDVLEVTSTGEGGSESQAGAVLPPVLTRRPMPAPVHSMWDLSGCASAFAGGLPCKATRLWSLKLELRASFQACWVFPSVWNKRQACLTAEDK